MHRLAIAAFATLAVLMPTITKAQNDNSHISDSLRTVLTTAKSAADSIRILYDIFDLSSSRGETIETSNAIYNLAKRAGDTKAQIDMLKHMANMNSTNDSILTELKKIIITIEPSDDQKDAETFISLKRITSQLWHSDEHVRQKRINEVLKSWSKDKPTDLYKQIERTFAMCIFLGFDSESNLAPQNLAKLKQLIDQLPEDSYALRNYYYTMAAIIYTLNNNHKKAIESDLELLDQIKVMQNNYLKQGRKYRNYDDMKFNSYRRILSNYKGLPLDEVNRYYNKIKELTKTSYRAKYNFEHNERASIYYLLANKRYKEAIPIIERQYNNPQNASMKMQLMKELMNAADKVNDQQTLSKYALEYSRLLEDYIDMRASDHYKELQVMYDIDDLRSQNTTLEIERREALLSANKYLIGVLAFTIVGILILLIFLYRNYLRTRRLTIELSESNQSLKQERDNLELAKKDLIKSRDKAYNAERQKTDFINSVSHEVKTPLDNIVEYSQLIVDSAIDSDKKQYFDHFATLVKFNSDLLQTIVNDILDTSTLESGKKSISKSSASIQMMCNMAITAISKRIPDGVEFKFLNKDDHDTLIYTDSQRVVQVLINMLSNAVKFTQKGEITLSYELNDARTTATFYVTDTGIGVPSGKEDVIFERFEKIDPYSQGTGLGLYICKLISQLLGGSIRLDKTYRVGAKFIFTIPTIPDAENK